MKVDRATGGLLVKQVGGGGAKTVITLFDGVTTNTTSPAVAVPAGRRTIQARIVGTGAVSATVSWFGNNVNTASGGELFATSTLSGTTSDHTGADIDQEWPYVYCTSASIAGTGAAVTADVAV